MGVLRYEFAAVAGRDVVLPFGDHSRVRVRKAGDSSSRVAFARLPDWPEMEVWRSVLRPGDLFVDVGANVGLYTLLACERGADVISFEPAADMVDALRDNLALNDHDGVDVRPVAVVDQVGTGTLDGPDPNRRRVTVAATAEVAIAVSTLDAELQGRSPKGIKIDVEGLERLVIDGASAILAADAPLTIQLEWNEASIEALGESRAPVADRLRAAGLRLFQCPSSCDRFVEFDSEVPPYGNDVFATRGPVADLLRRSPWARSAPG